MLTLSLVQGGRLRIPYPVLLRGQGQEQPCAVRGRTRDGRSGRLHHGEGAKGVINPETTGCRDQGWKVHSVRQQNRCSKSWWLYTVQYMIYNARYMYCCLKSGVYSFRQSERRNVLCRICVHNAVGRRAKPWWGLIDFCPAQSRLQTRHADR